MALDLSKPLSVSEAKELLWDREANKARVYQPLEHPDFADWESHQPCEERWQMILPESDQVPEIPIRLGRKRVVDLGCHTGWFCRAFSHRGWEALGIDQSPEYINIARHLMGPFGGHPKPVYSVENILNADFEIPHAEVVLCLSILMYLLSPENSRQGWESLKKVSQSSLVMFADFGGMYSDQLPQQGDDLCNLIVEKTEYESWELLGQTALQSRPFYIFRRT